MRGSNPAPPARSVVYTRIVVSVGDVCCVVCVRVSRQLVSLSSSR